MTSKRWARACCSMYVSAASQVGKGAARTYSSPSAAAACVATPARTSRSDVRVP